MLHRKLGSQHAGRYFQTAGCHFHFLNLNVFLFFSHYLLDYKGKVFKLPNTVLMN